LSSGALAPTTKTWFLRAAKVPAAAFLSGMNTVFVNLTNDVVSGLVINEADDHLTLVDSSFWIPISCTSGSTEFEIDNVESIQKNFQFLEFNCVPTIFTVKLAFLKILFGLSAFDAMRLLSNLWNDQSMMEKKKSLSKAAELIFFFNNVMQDIPDREQTCMLVFGVGYHQTISKIDLIKEMLLRDIASVTTPDYEIPKWKGRSMQFIELISIGIELDLFEGQNQNEICNSLLKAFQVEAESDQPIYKQRFNALFKRSKIHLPLIADYISRVEEAKKMKILFTQERY
jgi:hypothetical protein